MSDCRQLEQEKAKLLEAVAFHKKRADEAIKAAMDLDVKAGMYKAEMHRLHNEYHTTVGALELMAIENKDLKDTVSEVATLLRDALEAYDAEPGISIMEGYVEDAVRILEETE